MELVHFPDNHRRKEKRKKKEKEQDDDDGSQGSKKKRKTAGERQSLITAVSYPFIFFLCWLK